MTEEERRAFEAEKSRLQDKALGLVLGVGAEVTGIEKDDVEEFLKRKRDAFENSAAGNLVRNAKDLLPEGLETNIDLGLDLNARPQYNFNLPGTPITGAVGATVNRGGVTDPFLQANMPNRFGGNIGLLVNQEQQRLKYEQPIGGLLGSVEVEKTGPVKSLMFRISSQLPTFGGK